MLSALCRSSDGATSISVTKTPLRFATSVSRSSKRERVEEMDGNVAWDWVERGVPMLAEGGLERGTGNELG